MSILRTRSVLGRCFWMRQGGVRMKSSSAWAAALGFRFFAGEEELSGPVSELVNVTRIESPKEDVEALVPSAYSKDRRLTQPPLQRVLPKIIAAADVRNPLLGGNGATRIFGPQKGASDDKIDKLERALARLANLVAKEF